MKTVMMLMCLLAVSLLAGCTDNRIRTKPTLDYKIPPARKAELQRHVTRIMYEQRVLRDFEERK